MHRMPAHVQQWIKGGMAKLDLWAFGSSLVETDKEEVEDGKIIVNEFHNEEYGGFHKLATKHTVHVADILNSEEVQEVITNTPRCTGAIVHLAQGSPVSFSHNQLVTLFRHMLLFAADHIAFLVCFYCVGL